MTRWSVSIRVYRFPNISRTVTSMLTWVNDGTLAAAPSCAFTGFCPGLAAHWAAHSGPLTPIHQRAGQPQTAPTASIIMGLQGKVHSLVMEMHRRPPGFSGFLAALQFILPHAKQRKKKGENVVVFLLCARCPGMLSALISVCLS